MEVKQLEMTLAAESARIRKYHTGRGPTGCKVRIMDSVIIIRSRLELTPMEKLMLKHLTNAEDVMDEYQQAFMPDMEKAIVSIHEDLKVEDFRTIIGSDEIFTTIITMNMDLEKLISSSKVSKLRSPAAH